MSYKKLLTYQQATIIYDYTVEFCKKYIPYNSRTRDQMVQAARSGKQNIVEGCSFSRTSSKMEIKLIGVARASFEELLEDYYDFLRQRNLKIWEKDSIGARNIRKFSYKPDKTYKSYISCLENPCVAANTAICLIHQTNYLLDQQIRRLEKDFVEKGGYTENLYKKRIDFRN